MDHQLNVLVAEVSVRFVQVSDGRSLDQTINYTLESLGRLFEVGRCYLFRFSGDLSTMDNTHEWCANHVVSQRERMQQFPTAQLSWWMKQMLDLQPLCISDVESLPAEAAAEKEELFFQDVCSLICLPICDNNMKLIGFMGIDAVNSTYAWSEQQVAMLQVLAGHWGHWGQAVKHLLTGLDFWR